MFARLLILCLCLFGAAPGFATELDYTPYLAHLSDIECLHFTYDCGGYYDLGVKGTFAYALSENNGLQVIDVSDPLAPVNRGYLPFGHSAWANHLALQDHYAFVGASGAQRGRHRRRERRRRARGPRLAAAGVDPAGRDHDRPQAVRGHVDGQLSVFDTNVPTQPQFVTPSRRPSALAGNSSSTGAGSWRPETEASRSTTCRRQTRRCCWDRCPWAAACSMPWRRRTTSCSPRRVRKPASST